MKRSLYMVILVNVSIFFISCYTVSHVQRPNLYTVLDQQTAYVETYSEIKAVECISNNQSISKESCARILENLPNIYGRYMGTGTFIYYKNKLSILTAEHVCYPVGDVPREITRNGVTVRVEHKIEIGIKSRNFSSGAKIIKKNGKLDLCILELEEYPTKFFDPARISASGPNRGDSVYYAGGPLGMISENALPVFQGMYAGKIWGMWLFSLPCAGGASGSSIRNSENQIISMVQRVHSRFAHLCYGIDTESIRNFINN